MESQFSPLFDETLEPRHFSEMGLSRQRLLQWFEASPGLEPHRDNPNKRRRFSPAQVLCLGAIKAIKDFAPVALNEQASLVAAIIDPQFTIKAVGLWKTGKSPILLTNLRDRHWLCPWAEVQASASANIGRTFASLDLEPAIAQMLAAMLRGDGGQRVFAAKATAEHALSLKVKEAKRRLDIEDCQEIHTEHEALAHVLLRLR